MASAQSESWIHALDHLLVSRELCAPHFQLSPRVRSGDAMPKSVEKFTPKKGGVHAPPGVLSSCRPVTLSKSLPMGSQVDGVQFSSVRILGVSSYGVYLSEFIIKVRLSGGKCRDVDVDEPGLQPCQK